MDDADADAEGADANRSAGAGRARMLLQQAPAVWMVYSINHAGAHGVCCHADGSVFMEGVAGMLQLCST